MCIDLPRRPVFEGGTCVLICEEHQRFNNGDCDDVCERGQRFDEGECVTECGRAS